MQAGKREFQKHKAHKNLVLAFVSFVLLRKRYRQAMLLLLLFPFFNLSFGAIELNLIR